jgi:hypothetical protein
MVHAPAKVFFGTDDVDGGKAFGASVGKRVKDPVVDQAENGGGRADAEREGQYDDARETGALAKNAQGEAQVLQEIFKQREPSQVAVAFLGLLDTAELEQGLAPGFRRGHASAEIVGDVKIEMCGEFVIEVAVKTLRRTRLRLRSSRERIA